MRIDTKGMHYRIINEQIRSLVEKGKKHIVLNNVNGQRYIGCGLNANVDITVNGVPGNDLAAFMDGPLITVNGNGQDAIGNTMNAGKVMILGDAGDVLGYSMRGGKLYIRGNVGYRVGIHMKSYKDRFPVIIIGGKAEDFFGEYMAGGILILLGLNTGGNKSSIVGNYVGTGMHGGVMYLRGRVNRCQLGKEVGVDKLNSEDMTDLRKYLGEFCTDSALDLEEVLKQEFIKLIPHSHRPYGKIYAY